MQNKESLQNKFENYGARPTDALWDSIASKLKAKKKKKILFFWWFGSGIATIISLVFGLIFYFNDSNNTLKLASFNTIEKYKNININLEKNTANLNNTTQQVNINKDEVVNSSFESEDLAVDNLKRRVELNTPSKPPIVKKIPNKSKSEVLPEALKANTKLYIKSETSKTGINILFDSNERYNLICKTCNSIMNPRHIELLSTIFDQNISIYTLDKLKKTRRFQYSLNLMTFFNIKNKEQYAVPSQTSNLDGNFSSINESLTPSTSSQLQTSIPLSLRFGIATPLTKRFKFQTGLDVGWIRKSTENPFPKSSNLTVGIPLFLKFNIVNRRRFDINSKVGALNDFNLLEYNKGYPTSTLSSTKSFLGGIEVGLSFDYKLTEKFKIAIGTGFRTYYYQSKPILNYATNKNAFYSLNVGIIWNY
jgi:hypothetical protein